jgi:hypothetical protein
MTNWLVGIVEKMSWIEIWKLVSELAFREGGRAILWLLIGGGLGLLLSLLGILVCWISTKKSRLFRDDSYGTWARRILLLVWMIVVPAILVSNGALWGLFVAAEKTVVSQNLIEKAFQESLTTPLTSLIDEVVRGEATLQRVEQQLLVSELKVTIDGAEEELVTVVWEKFAAAFKGGDSAAESKTPLWLKNLIAKAILHLSEGDGVNVSELLRQAREVVVMAQSLDGTKDDLVTEKELAWSAGAVIGVPLAKEYAKSLRVGLLIAAGVQALTALAVVLVVVWGAYRLLISLFGGLGKGRTPKIEN